MQKFLIYMTFWYFFSKLSEIWKNTDIVQWLKMCENCSQKKKAYVFFYKFQIYYQSCRFLGLLASTTSSNVCIFLLLRNKSMLSFLDWGFVNVWHNFWWLYNVGIFQSSLNFPKQKVVLVIFKAKYPNVIYLKNIWIKIYKIWFFPAREPKK